MRARPKGTRNPGLAAAIAKANDSRTHHLDWLSLLEVSGPFLTLPVLMSVWDPLDSLDKGERERLRDQHTQWQTDPAGGAAEWAHYLLHDLLEWRDALAHGPDADALWERLALPVGEYDTEVRPDFALLEPDCNAKELAAAELDRAALAKRVPLLGMTLPAGSHPTTRLRDGGTWAATPADRMAKLLRHHGIDLGLVTDGRWWCLVWAPIGGVTTTAVFDTVGWNEAAERNSVRAWISLLRRSRFFAALPDQRLVPLLKRSLENQDDVTEALGVQVRQAVELLVDAIGRADLRAVERGEPSLRERGVSAGEVYRGAVTVMMRVVFLLFAEERGLLPADNQVYANAYSAGLLSAELERRADADLENTLEQSTAGWHRLIALFHAVYGGIDHPGLRLPAYSGSLFDPDRYWWLEGRPRPRNGEEKDMAAGAEVGGTVPLLPIDDRTVLHMLAAVQYVTIGGDKRAKSARQLAADAAKPAAGRRKGERRRLTFRALDVEQIGYVYEGLLSYDGRRAAGVVVGLIGPLGKENEVPLEDLERLAAPFGVGAKAAPGSRADLKGLAKALVETFKEPKPGIGSVGVVEKALAPLKDTERETAEGDLFGRSRDRELVERLLPFYGIIRTDLQGLPMVIRPGALYVTESSLRKNTGTHYTPRALAEEVVEGALAPLVYEPGPLQTADQSSWELKPAEEILRLKVADIAMGSAAFLVAACRYLADRLVQAWAEEGDERAMRVRDQRRMVDATTEADAEAEPVRVEARRQVIERCLYGVDINPLAVEMAKLSLWLVSMDPERPFTFLDDRLVAGDSLLGVTAVEQLETVNLDPVEGRKAEAGALFDWTRSARRRVAGIAEDRRAISEISSDGPAGVERKRRQLIIVHKNTERLALIGDLTAGAGLVTAGAGAAARKRTHEEAAQIASEVGPEDVDDSQSVVKAARERAEEWLRKDLPDDGFVRDPVHWPLEFPEVFEAGKGGFDAVIGNPPFLGGQKLTGALGEAYREYLVHGVGRGKRGSADLVAYFALRAHQLLNAGGQTGLIATNTLAQGDTREVGLDQIVADGVEIRRAVKSAPWPSKSAVLEYCAVWTSAAEVGERAERVLGGVAVPGGIGTSLSPRSRVSEWAEPLNANQGISFQGSNILGLGFTLPEEEARAWIAEDERYADVLFPYLNGEDVNRNPSHKTDRWVIDFQTWPEGRAREYQKAYIKILRDVKPERSKNKDKSRREIWWRFTRPAMDLRKAINKANLDSCIVLSLVGKAAMPAIVSTGQVFSHMLAVFSSDDTGMLAILSSGPHYWWTLSRASTLETRIRYTPSDVFETFVRPEISEDLRFHGSNLHEFRRELMLRRNIGLTATYNLVHNPDCTDGDIVELRSIHRQIDIATAQAYGWDDLLGADNGLDHGFHATDQGIRYTIGLIARTEILDRLRELNHQRYTDEVFLGLHKKPKTYPDMPKPSPQAHQKMTERTGAVFPDDGLFPPDDALF
ncbi:Eco57I restriction-modification methylase domain-containing protein [Streptomyces harbinensis]